MAKQSNWMRGLLYAEQLAQSTSLQIAWHELAAHSGPFENDFDKGARDYLHNIARRRINEIS